MAALKRASLSTGGRERAMIWRSLKVVTALIVLLVPSLGSAADPLS